MLKTDYAKRVYEKLCVENKGETEYLNAALEILESIENFVSTKPEYEKTKLLERFVEPERGVEFKVDGKRI